MINDKDMIYLELFQIPSDLWVTWYFTPWPIDPPPADMPPEFLCMHPDKCSYHNTWYPWKVFENRFLSGNEKTISNITCPKLSFSDITIFYGGNGSGKSTLLNVIAEKLHSDRAVRHNTSPFFDDYVGECMYYLNKQYFIKDSDIPRSRIIVSDEVFKQLLSTRENNFNINMERGKLRQEYYDYKYTQLPSHIDPYDKEQMKIYSDMNETRKHNLSQYINRRLRRTDLEKSNGEAGFHYFVESITDDCLILLDEPENSLSAMWQKELALFIQGAVKEFRCQFIIATHSPFLLSIPQAKIYDLDATPIQESTWNRLESMRCYYELFKDNEDLFN